MQSVNMNPISTNGQDTENSKIAPTVTENLEITLSQWTRLPAQQFQTGQKNRWERMIPTCKGADVRLPPYYGLLMVTRRNWRPWVSLAMGVFEVAVTFS